MDCKKDINSNEKQDFVKILSDINTMLEVKKKILNRNQIRFQKEIEKIGKRRTGKMTKNFTKRDLKNRAISKKYVKQESIWKRFSKCRQRKNIQNIG